MTMDEQDRQLRAVLADHAGKYPLMRPQDAVKLVYQNEFGGGHLVTDPEAGLTRLREELAQVEGDPEAPLTEELGNGLVRVMLAGLAQGGYPLEELNRDFARSARLHTGRMPAFLHKLDVLRALTGEGIFGFSPAQLEDYLTAYCQAGCPMVSHSPQYRRAYRPAYRVVRRSTSAALLADEATGLLTTRPRVLVALDGRCASGKTTLAARLHDRWGWAVVHMDDFFLRPEQRTPQRYSQPGGNIDHERFLTQVLEPLRRGEQVAYRPFDCGTQQLGEPVQVEDAPVILVEGSYSCHPALWPHYDLHAFLTVAPEEQLRRLEGRNGAEYTQVFQTRWIPLEEAYFAAYDIAQRCDYQLEL